jgi:hypothetical protein
LLPLLPDGLVGRFGADPGVVEPSLCCPVAPPLGVCPVVPLMPDELERSEAVLPPEAESRLHPERIVPLSASATAAANAVNFMLTSIGCVP